MTIGMRESLISFGFICLALGLAYAFLELVPICRPVANLWTDPQPWTACR